MLTRRSLAALLLAVSTVATIAGPAQTATGRFNYVGWSGGSAVRAVGTTVTSDLTAQSYVAGITVPKSASNNVATVVVGDLLRVGAVETQETAVEHEGGIRLTSIARTANVSVLNGLIRADAITTRAVATALPGNVMSTAGRTEFLNLHIFGHDLPVNIEKNFKVKIPGVATVIANGVETTENNGIVTTLNYGLKIILLEAFGPYGAKTVVVLNPSFAGIAPEIPVNQPVVTGQAFGTRVHTAAGSSIKVDSGKTAAVATPPGGSADQVISNSTAMANVRGVLTTGAIFSTTQSLAMPNFAEVTNANEIVGINLLDGLITADVIKTRAYCKRVDNVFSSALKLNFVNLTVAGNEIPIDVAPNTKITLGDLAEVTINKQIKTPQLAAITGIEIRLLKPVGDTPAGALVEISQAWCWIPPT